MVPLGRERPPSRRQRTLEQRYLTVKSDIERRRHSGPTTTGQTLRGVTMKKVWWDEIRSQLWNDANLEMNVFPYVVFVQALLMPRSTNSSGVYCPKYKTYFSLVSLSPRTRFRPGAERVRQGEGRLSRPRRTCFIRSSPADVKQNKQTLKPCRR